MGSEVDPLDLIERTADERLLLSDSSQLPSSLPEPPQPLPESRVRRQVVRTGAVMTGVTLIGGTALAVLGLVEVIAEGSLVWFIVLALGVLLAATHWGWVHVAELTGNTIEARRDESVQARREQWLRALEPYARWEVVSSTERDGSIVITTLRHQPVPGAPGRFSFTREEVSREVHSAHEPAATVAERAELLRRQAAAETERARQAFEAARDAFERTLLARDDEQQRQAALRAASQALSERINANLRDPPLVE
jgi:hypothetical protein